VVSDFKGQEPPLEADSSEPPQNTYEIPVDFHIDYDQETPETDGGVTDIIWGCILGYLLHVLALICVRVI